MSERPTCKRCGVKPARLKHTSSAGFKRFKAECQSCYQARRRQAGNPVPKGLSLRKRYLESKCDSCEFEPEHLIQLQIDHIDGNSANNHPSNLQTLCANCHALKTWTNGDYRTPSRQIAPYVWTRDGWKDRRM